MGLSTRGPLSDEDLITAIYAELDRTTEFGVQSLVENRKKAWDYYFNRARGDEIEGRSQVQDTSVRDTVHAMLAAIMPAYATDNPISFEPDGPDDIDAADAESRSVNNIFTEDTQGFMQLRDAIQDALLFRNGIIKVWIDEQETVTTRAFRAPVADVMAQVPEGEEWEFTETDDQGLNHFKITVDEQKLIVEAIEPALFYVDPNMDTQNLQDSGYLAELTYLTRGELVAMDVSAELVAELPSTPDNAQTSGSGVSNTDQLAKFIEAVSSIGDAATWDRQTIECYWIHMVVDRDGDGIPEKYRFLIAHRKLLIDDQVSWAPYASGTGWPVPHRWSGLSVYDLARITQDERTSVRRQALDNLMTANNQRPVFDPGETEAEDVTNGAPGRGIRSRNPANVTWMPVQDLVSNSLAYLNYTDQTRSEQTGAALALGSADATMLSEASGISVDMQLQPREQTAQMVSRNIAETLVRNMFLLIHQTLREQWHGTISYLKSGDWQETNPAEWRPRSRINVSVGLSPGERRRQQQALQFVLQMQLQMIQGGVANIATTYNGVHSALVDWMAAVELDGAEGYFLDPDGTESQAGQKQAQDQQRQAQEQAEQQQQIGLQLEQMEQAFEKYKNDTNLQFDYWAKIMDTDGDSRKLAQEGQQAIAELDASEGAEGAARSNGADR